MEGKTERELCEVIIGVLAIFSMAFQGDSIFWVEVEKVVPNPFQPRREFDEQKLIELSESVRMYGIMQPLTVTRKEIQREDGTFYTEYELIAGERRLRASKLAGLTQVPVIIREGEESEQEKLELAIIENLQREDLSAIDRALAFRQLAEVFGLSHTQVAKKVGRSREYISNSIRLLALPDYMQSSLRQGEMTEGHARTLLMLNDRPEEQDVVFREILLKKLSVREVERIVRKIATDKVRKKHPGEFDAELIEIEKKFMETLGTRVQIQKTDFGGKLTIDYFSVDDLEGILTRVKSEGLAKSGSMAAMSAAEKLTAHTPLTVESPIDDDGRDTAAITDEEMLSPETAGEVAPVESPSTPQPVEYTESVVPESEPVKSFNPLANITRLSGFHGHHPVSAASVHVPASTTTPTPAPAPQVPVAPEVKQVVAEYHSQVPAPFTPAPVPTISGEEEQALVVETPKPEPKKDDDDSGMYSIRNFSV
jgi:ParB family chromosome partitioning protein